MTGIDDKDNLYIHCANGYRSVIAASLMKRAGHTQSAERCRWMG